MSNNHDDEFWMQYAITLAKKAEIEEEVPVGAVLILNGNIIGEGWNCSMKQHDPTAHAEIISIRRGGKKINNYRLLHTTMYITLEPCIMCIGAIISARIQRVVFGALREKTNMIEMLESIFYYYNIQHKILFTSGILSSLCTIQLKNFFHQLRIKKKSY